MEIASLLSGLSFALLSAMTATFWKVNVLSERVSRLEQKLSDLMEFLRGGKHGA